MAEQYRLYGELGVRYMFEESAGDGTSPLQPLRSYVRSQLTWNPYQNTESLVAEFMENYYGYGGKYVEKYFNAVMEHFQNIYTMAGEACQGCFYDVSKTNYWPHSTLLEFCSLLENAMLEIDVQTTLDENQKEIYKERVFREYVLMKINEYNRYSGFLTPEELAEVKRIVDIGKSRYEIA